jgi:beta-lactamase regulating signal transducer with metallopeptidase domain
MMVTLTDLAEWTLRSSLVLGLTLGTASILPHGRPERRHAVLVTGLLLGVLLPALCGPIGGFELAILPADSEGASQAGRDAGGGATSILATGALTIWLIGCVILAIRLVWGHLEVRRCTRRARPLVDARWQGHLKVLSADLELRGPARLRIGSGISTPFTCGLLRPAILVPESARRWPLDELRATLAHELGHVVRRDCAARLATQIACVLQWFNPLVWILRDRLLAEQEEACDRLALRSGLRPSQYATALVTIRRALATPTRRRVPLAASPLGDPDALARRLTSLLGVTAPRPGAPAVVFAAGLAILALPLATLRLSHRHEVAERGPIVEVAAADPAPAGAFEDRLAEIPPPRAPRPAPPAPASRAEPPPPPASATPAGSDECGRRVQPRRTSRGIRFTVIGVVRVVVGWPG